MGKKRNTHILYILTFSLIYTLHYNIAKLDPEKHLVWAQV